jgi:DNA polymerase-3 subunit beta
VRIIINQKTLNNKISIAQKAINSKTTIEILKGLLLVAKHNQLKIIGYDTEIGIETYTNTQIVEEGQIVVDARLFGDIIRKLPDEEVQIETDSENNLYINCLNSKFKIKGYSPVDFPKLPEFEEDNSIEISQELFKDMIKQTVFSTSIDPTKPTLMGELLEIEENSINLVAMDGYRLSVRKSFINTPQGYETSQSISKLIIPEKTMRDVNTLLSEEDNFKIEFNEKNIVFIIGDTKIISRLLEGKYVDYKKFLPKEHTTKIRLNTKDLYDSIERASLLSAEKNNLIKFSIRDNVMAITSNNEKGNVYEEVSLELEGEYLDIAFNSRYLSEGLKNIESTYINIEFTKNINPCIIKPDDEIDYTYLLLPVRLS